MNSVTYLYSTGMDAYHVIAIQPDLQKMQLLLLLHVWPCLQICCLAMHWPNPLQYFDISLLIHVMTQCKGLCLLVRKCTMAYRPIAKQFLCKQCPFLGNGSVKMFPWPWIHTQQNSWKWDVFMWSMPRCYKQGTESAVKQFFVEGCKEKSLV
jgi:hypothetical protein